MSAPGHLGAARGELTAWLIDGGLALADFKEVLAGFCERLNARGVAVARVNIGSDLLHPVLETRGFRWRRGQAIEQEEFERGGVEEEAWLTSPFYHLLQSGAPELRRRLTRDFARGEFPLLDQFRDSGFTDYIAFMVKFGAEAALGEQQGVMCSLTCDGPDGFSDAEIELLRHLARPIALAFKAIDGVHTTRVLMATYLGDDPARRVLRGDIARGVAESVDAVLWYSDLTGFMRIADGVPRDGMMARLNGYTALMGLLNAYTDGLVTVIREHGGEVLKFVGDGILAKFKHDGDSAACDVALDAAAAALAAVDRISHERAAKGETVTDVNLALHAGEVLYGNIGSRDRLDFTVIGPAVNEVMRIEAMCRLLDQRLIVSSAFAGAAGTASERLVSLGRFALPGVRKPEELFTLDPEHDAIAARAA